MKKSLEPRWNQTFMYSPVHQREFRERTLELTVWDQARVREEESQFLGQVRTSCNFRCSVWFYYSYISSVLDPLEVLEVMGFVLFEILHLLVLLAVLNLGEVPRGSRCSYIYWRPTGSQDIS